ncbi:MAG TPA: SMC-Scp complex subunit ScpB [Candidatus Dormibacteraeota bacterium]
MDDVLVLDVFGRATVPDGTADAEPEDLAPALEALCFALGREVSIAEAAATLDRSPSAVTNAAAVLAMQLRGRGLMLQRSAESVQLVTRPEMAWAVQRGLHPERPSRLSRAAMETLAIIAYRQPATKAVIESIRGVDCEAVLEHLTERGLIEEIARQDSPGHPRLFGTTLRFLQLVGLERIEDLPPVSESAALPILE